MLNSHLEHAELIEAAERLAPLLREKAREAEIVRKPLDEVIDAIRESRLFSLMRPKCYGGHEADVDTFFEVSLILSRADASMGWLVAFYMEHTFWFCGFPEDFQRELFSKQSYVLAPATLNIGGRKAEEVDGGYRISGRWQWGTGVVHADWVLVGALSGEAATEPASDWSFAANVRFGHLETQVPSPRTITVSCIVSDGQLYVGCSSCSGRYWSQQLLAVPDVRYRVLGTIYNVTATKVTDREEVNRGWRARAAKYGNNTPDPIPDDFWFFRLVSR